MPYYQIQRYRKKCTIINNLKIEIINEKSEIIEAKSDYSENVLIYRDEYKRGDKIVFHVDKVPAFYGIKIDDTIEEAVVYVKENTVEFKIPYDKEKESLNPKSFQGNIHYISLRETRRWELEGIRNISKNTIDQHENNGCYPHASANVETRNETVFAANNAIDGLLASDYHGMWPYGSWGINMQEDAELLLDFGRPIDIVEIDLYTRSDFPHDSWWNQGEIIFSNGEKEVLHMEKSNKAHVFSVNKKSVTWIKLCNLIKADDLSKFPALTQIVVYGSENLE